MRHTKKLTIEEYAPLKTQFSIQEEIRNRVEKEAWAVWSKTDPEHYQVTDIPPTSEKWSAGWYNFFKNLKP